MLHHGLPGFIWILLAAVGRDFKDETFLAGRVIRRKSEADRAEPLADRKNRCRSSFPAQLLRQRGQRIGGEIEVSPDPPLQQQIPNGTSHQIKFAIVSPEDTRKVEYDLHRPARNWFEKRGGEIVIRHWLERHPDWA